jgi:hypothetical protein
MSKWPTLSSRLKHPLTSEKEAILQLKKSVEITPLAKKKLKKKS